MAEKGSKARDVMVQTLLNQPRPVMQSIRDAINRIYISFGLKQPDFLMQLKDNLDREIVSRETEEFSKLYPSESRSFDESTIAARVDVKIDAERTFQPTGRS